MCYVNHRVAGKHVSLPLLSRRKLPSPYFGWYRMEAHCRQCGDEKENRGFAPRAPGRERWPGTEQWKQVASTKFLEETRCPSKLTIHPTHFILLQAGKIGTCFSYPHLIGKETETTENLKHLLVELDQNSFSGVYALFFFFFKTS